MYVCTYVRCNYTHTHTQRSLVASAVKYGALANEIGFVIDEMDETLAEPILGNR